MRIFFASIMASIAAAGPAACTETPSSFPPCILDAPCPDAALDDGGGDAAEGASDEPDGSVGEASDASPEAS